MSIKTLTLYLQGIFGERMDWGGGSGSGKKGRKATEGASGSGSGRGRRRRGVRVGGFIGGVNSLFIRFIIAK